MNQIEPGVQYNYVYEDDEYMIQEEEWDRDLLLDPAWEKQQRKVSQGRVPAVCGLDPRVCVSPFPGGDRPGAPPTVWTSGRELDGGSCCLMSS